MEEDDYSGRLPATDFFCRYLTEVFYIAPPRSRRKKRQAAGLTGRMKHSGLFDMGNGYYLRITPTDEGHCLSNFDVSCLAKSAEGCLVEGQCKFEEFDQPMRFSYKALQNYMAKISKDPDHSNMHIPLARRCDDFPTPVVRYIPTLFLKSSDGPIDFPHGYCARPCHSGLGSAARRAGYHA